MGRSAVMRFSCPLCGGDLRDSVGNCNTCPMSRGCTMLCCENCGYSTVAPESSLVDFFKRLFRRRTRSTHSTSESA